MEEGSEEEEGGRDGRRRGGKERWNKVGREEGVGGRKEEGREEERDRK